jgi:hypothetical protein
MQLGGRPESIEWFHRGLGAFGTLANKQCRAHTRSLRLSDPQAEMTCGKTEMEERHIKRQRLPETTARRFAVLGLAQTQPTRLATLGTGVGRLLPIHLHHLSCQLLTVLPGQMVFRRHWGTEAGRHRSAITNCFWAVHAVARDICIFGKAYMVVTSLLQDLRAG